MVYIEVILTEGLPKFTQVGTVAQAQTSLIRAFLKVLVFEKLEKKRQNI